MTPLPPPERSRLELKLEAVRVAANSLVRLSLHPETEPYWSRGRYRFDGPASGEPDSFGTCYASDDIEVSFCESVIHDSAWLVDGRYQVPHALLTGRHVVQLHRPHRPELVLADLSGKALKKLGLNNDLCSGDDYIWPRSWGRAIHDASGRWDGIRYVSRQHNGGYAVALFERSGVTKAKSRKLQGKELDRLCDMFDVVAI